MKRARLLLPLLLTVGVTITPVLVSSAAGRAEGSAPELVSKGATGEARLYPALFGTHESYSPNIGRFFKWTGMLERWHEQRRAAVTPCGPAEFNSCEPAQWRRIVGTLRPLGLSDKITTVNALINRYPYVPSAVNWNDPNYWETPFEFFRKSGQCQDYAITKFMLLRAAGVPNDVMRLVVLRDIRLGLDHAVVVVYVDGQALMLDNQIQDVVPVESVGHYRPYYSINETGWWLHEPNPLSVTSASLH